MSTSNPPQLADRMDLIDRLAVRLRKALGPKPGPADRRLLAEAETAVERYRRNVEIRERGHRDPYREALAAVVEKLGRAEAAERMGVAERAVIIWLRGATAIHPPWQPKLRAVATGCGVEIADDAT